MDTRTAGSVARRINAERFVLAGWSRAILMQLAHPLVAAGVAEHSSFREGRFSAALRLHHTVRAMLSLTFGTGAERRATLDAINGIHRRVNGVLREDVGRFRAGTRYSAEDPALLMWVHATLLESIPLAYHQLARPLTDGERDAYCRDTASLPQELGAPEPGPSSWQELQAYLECTYESGTIAVGAQARELASAVLAPPLAWLVAPAAAAHRLLAVGWLPRGVREQYGFEWTTREERRLGRTIRALRVVRRLMPDTVALWPEARTPLPESPDRTANRLHPPP